MDKAAVKALKLGAYFLHWKSGGLSLAAVGADEFGERWMAPCNWVSPTNNQKFWQQVARAERVICAPRQTRTEP